MTATIRSTRSFHLPLWAPPFEVARWLGEEAVTRNGGWMLALIGIDREEMGWCWRHLCHDRRVTLTWQIEPRPAEPAA